MKKITLLFVLSSFLSFAQSNTDKIQSYLNENHQKFDLTKADVSDWVVESTSNSTASNVDIYYVLQRYQGIEIFRGLSNFAIKNGDVIYVGNRFVSHVSEKINTTTPLISMQTALNKAYIDAGITNHEPFLVLESGSNRKATLSNGIGIEEPVMANLVFQQTKQNLKLAWDFTFYTPKHDHGWSVRIDATNGQVLEKNDIVISCHFDKTNSCHESSIEKNPFDLNFHKKNNSILNTTNVLGGSYRVIPFNYESPSHSPFQLVTNPEDATASSKGWHDTNTLTGNVASFKYTITRGNNVWSRTDYSATNPTVGSTTITANGYSPDGGASLVFDFPYSGTSVAANNSVKAACTNLFYMNNISHDVWQHYGFDEASGNFQQTNYSNVSGASDFVYGDAQDGSTLSPTPSMNNANFSTPVDGQKPRMQMFLWSVATQLKPLIVTAPSVIAGDYYAKQNSFSPGHVDLPLAPNFIQSDLVKYDDGTPDVGQTDNADGCGAAVNAAAINGHIAIIRRSTSAANGGAPCAFTEKVKNAQNAGAIAVIIVDNVDATYPIGMSGADATITIPAIAVTKAVGDLIFAKMALGTVNVKLQLPANYTPFVNSDGDFDNGIIAHEYGHGISTRLTGGKNNSSCLQNTDQAGEGWSDWFALMLQLKPGDVSTTPHGIGTFVYSEPVTGGGIRDYPYTTDMTVNPMTYNTTNSYQYMDTNGLEQTEIHGTGSVWTTVLWDLTWAYINKYGYNDNKYTGTGGNNKLMRIVLDGLKLQPCSPSFVDSRNAIIAADQAITGGVDYCMIWEVFARRGLGVNASAGDTNVGNDQVADFTTPPAGPNCTLGTTNFDQNSLFEVYPNPSNGIYNLRINNFVGKITTQVVDINGRIVLNTTEDFNIEKELNISSLQSGIYILKIMGEKINYATKIIKN